MIVTLWGSRGSLACSGPEMAKYGGNTSCVSVYHDDTSLLVLDAGTGIRRLGLEMSKDIKRVDMLVTHLHLDHIQGLGFFAPLYDPAMEVHIYGPAKSEKHLREQLTRYLSLPLFPVVLHELPCKLYLHPIPSEEFSIGDLRVSCELVTHPGLTVGFRICSKDGCLAYIPDHEPALGTIDFPPALDWMSGYNIAVDADLLIHDAQYSLDEYPTHVGWGHSAVEHTLAFANVANVKNLVTFHHDPSHSDDQTDAILAAASSVIKPKCNVYAGWEGRVFNLVEGVVKCRVD